jgi:YhcH/YjgK/YiaL family protein
MILDSLAHSAQYAAIHPLFPQAFDYLRQFDAATPDGKYELDDKQLYAVVQRYETAPKEAKKWEAHRVYADIQYIVSGTEQIFYAPTPTLQTSVPYNDTKDVELFAPDSVKNASSLIIPGGFFGVFFPQDAHQPGCFVNQPEQILKVVIKVRI